MSAPNPAGEPPRSAPPRSAIKARAAAAGALAAARARWAAWSGRADPTAPLRYPKVFVVGCPRSGTTWVADTLGRHPDTVRGRESHVYPILERSIGRRGRFDVVAWARLFYGMDRGVATGSPTGLHHYLDRRTLARVGPGAVAGAPDDAAAVDRLARVVLDAFFAASGGTDDRVLVEKTPMHLLHAERILAAFPEAHLVVVVRDGRDVCVSMSVRQTQEVGWPTDREAQIRLWSKCARKGLALESDPALRGRVTTVRYEDLEADPARETARLLRETGLSASPALVDEIVAATDIGQYTTGAGRFRFRGRSGSWAELLSPEDQRRFRELVGGLFEEAGYSY